MNTLYPKREHRPLIDYIMSWLFVKLKFLFFGVGIGLGFGWGAIAYTGHQVNGVNARLNKLADIMIDHNKGHEGIVIELKEDAFAVRNELSKVKRELRKISSRDKTSL